ncbi:MAG: 2-isopropylmalate synthase [Clostridiales bacterium]|jgi:isopropylmalate/homocitrate/citramalate synthase|nr:2-isopropylmalate synthase [Clostridiales bacterium]
MIEFSDKTNLLERQESIFPLDDVKEPNLYRNLYSYTDVPKVAFNHRIVPIEMPKEIWVTDTTFRDGQQSREPYSVEQITHLFDLLHKLSGPKGIIRQSEFFVYSQKDQQAIYKCMEKGYEFPEVTCWIRATEKDFDIVKSIGIKETGILVSCSDYHIFHKLNMSRSQALNHYLGIIKKCLDYGIRPRCHFEDITRADFYGFVVPFARELMRLMDEAKMPVKIRACDTMGYGVTYPGAVLPRSVPGIIYGLHHYAKVPSGLLEWHGHNDFYKAVSNASYAWLFGASSVNCSLLGIGERTGNTPLEAMVIEYGQLRGTFDGMDTTVITEIADYYKNEIKYDIPLMTPFIGENFNVTRAGIHADGILKNEEIYNIFDTDKILNRPLEIAISKTSGLAGVAYWVNKYLNASYDKNHDVIKHVKGWIDNEYESGRELSISNDELSRVAIEAVEIHDKDK